MINRLVRRLDIEAVFLFTIFLVYLVYTPLTDFDYFWHLKAGEYLVTTGTIPDTDIFSYTNADKPWILHEWLFEAVLYTLYSHLGDIGVKLLVALSFIATIIFTHKTLSTYTTTNKFTLILTAVLLLLTLPPSPRPQLISYVLLSAYLLIISLHRQDNTNKSIWFLPPLMVIWVNSHGGYIIGIVALGLYAISEYIQIRLIDKNMRTREWINSLAPAAVITILATLVNPYHIEHWIYPFAVVTMQANSIILEWKAPSYKFLQEQAYLMIVFMYILSLLPQRKVSIGSILIPFFFIANAFLSLRHIAIAVIATAPYLVTNLYLMKERITWPAQSPLTRPTIFYSSNREMGIAENYMNLFLMFALTLTFYFLYQGNNVSEVKKRAELLPVSAVAYLNEHGIRGNLFNTYRYGGYLIYKLYPVQKVFIDGRADMYGDAFIQEYMQIFNGAPPWKTLLSKYEVDIVLCEINAPIHQLLSMDGDYQRIYSDDVNAIFVKSDR